MLYGLTVWVNFVSLLLALWLGLYLVTRSAHRPQAWLSALALWSTSGIFLNQLLALYPPPVPAPEAQAWVYHLILFWPRNVFELGWQGWLQGWLPTYGIAFWFHASLYFRPGVSNRARMVEALLGYVVALGGILFKVRYNSPWINTVGGPLYSSALPVPFSILFIIGFGIFVILSLVNLAQAARSSTNVMMRRPLRLILGAALLAAAAGLPGVVSSWYGIPIPQIWMALLLLAALLLGGTGIAQYHALLDHRPLRRDMLYSAVEAAAVLAIYLLFHRVITLLYPLPFISFVFVGCLAVFSHLLIDSARVHYDNLFPRGRDRLLNLHQPSRLSDHRDYKRALGPVSETLIDVTSATIETRNSFESEDRIIRSRNISSRLVELGLRNLHDYAYLADSPLANLRLVVDCTDGDGNGTNTFINRGKALSFVLSEAVNKLKPDLEEPSNTPPRSWYPYLILKNAYLEDVHNREIMANLYISEGTFNRTRRAAIQSVARILEEMESNLDIFPGMDRDASDPGDSRPT